MTILKMKYLQKDNCETGLDGQHGLVNQVRLTRSTRSGQHDPNSIMRAGRAILAYTWLCSVANNISYIYIYIYKNLSFSRRPMPCWLFSYLFCLEQAGLALSVGRFLFENHSQLFGLFGSRFLRRFSGSGFCRPSTLM